MATFFGEVVTGSYRFIDPENPDYNNVTGLQTWKLNSDDFGQESKLLIVTVGDIAGMNIWLLYFVILIKFCYRF